MGLTRQMAPYTRPPPWPTAAFLIRQSKQTHTLLAVAFQWRAGVGGQKEEAPPREGTFSVECLKLLAESSAGDHGRHLGQPVRACAISWGLGLRGPPVCTPQREQETARGAASRPGPGDPVYQGAGTRGHLPGVGGSGGVAGNSAGSLGPGRGASGMLLTLSVPGSRCKRALGKVA